VRSNGIPVAPAGYNCAFTNHYFVQPFQVYRHGSVPLEHWPYNKSRDIACIDASAPLNCAPLPPHFLAARAQKHLNFLGKVPAGEEEGERERERATEKERERRHTPTGPASHVASLFASNRHAMSRWINDILGRDCLNHMLDNRMPARPSEI